MHAALRIHRRVIWMSTAGVAALLGGCGGGTA